MRLEASDRELGLAGERLAARRLRRGGARVLGRRVRSPHGELDLVVRERGTLVVVEVKTARAAPGCAGPAGSRWRPGERLGSRDLARLRRAARRLAGGAPARVDLVEVWIGRGPVRWARHCDLRRPLAHRPHGPDGGSGSARAGTSP